MDEGEDSDINLIADCSKFSFEEIRRDLLIEKEAMKPHERYRNTAMVNYMVNTTSFKSGMIPLEERASNTFL